MGIVTVNVGRPGGGTATARFQDASMEVFEIILWFVGQDAIDADVSTWQTFGPGEISGCEEVPAGFDIPIRATLLIDEATVVDGMCDLEEGLTYTIVVQPDSPLEIACVVSAPCS